MSSNPSCTLNLLYFADIYANWRLGPLLIVHDSKIDGQGYKEKKNDILTITSSKTRIGPWEGRKPTSCNLPRKVFLMMCKVANPLHQEFLVFYVGDLAFLSSKIAGKAGQFQYLCMLQHGVTTWTWTFTMLSFSLTSYFKFHGESLDFT